MANEINTDILLEKKFESYKNDRTDNFVAAGEITVTITLGEYRRLIASDATTTIKIDAANSDKYSREAENKALKEENAALKSELYELKKALECPDTVVCDLS